MADRVAPGAFQQLHHFISASSWRPEPLEVELVRKAQDLVGGPDAVLAIDDTALVKQGQRVGRRGAPVLRSARQTGQLSGPGLAHPGPPRGAGLCRAAPVPAAKPGRGDIDRRFAPAFRCPSRSSPSGASPWRKSTASGLPGRCSAVWPPMPNMAKWRSSGPVWRSAGCATPSASRRPRRSIPPTSRSSPLPPARPVARPSTRCRRSRRRTVGETIAALPAHAWRFVSWRTGTKGRLRARFVALRVRVADGVRLRTGRRLPGSAAWLVCEQRTPDERRYYLTNHPEDTPLPALAADIKARWVCEQGHQQMKEELGPRSSGVPELDSSAPPHRPDNDRSVLSPACATWGKKVRRQRLVRATSAANPASDPAPDREGVAPNHRAMSLLPHPLD